MMQIAHEAPISIFRAVREHTDYDYALLHLLKDEEYKNLFQESFRMGRDVILDNSAFELGDALSAQELLKGMGLINPTYYIVPDALNDANTTIQRWEDFFKEKDSILTKSKSIGVVQGTTWDEYKECYKFMADHADKIALTSMLTPCFEGYVYNDPIINAFNNKWIGRTHIIRELMKEDIWNFDKPHHLLGCTNPIEFADPIYMHPCFESVDTSSPVMAGMQEVEYKLDGLTAKPKGKLCDHIHDELTIQQKDLIFRNIKRFRKFISHI